MADCKREATKDFKSVVAFSGGRTSAYMLRRLLDQHGDSLRKDWVVMFCNTGKEMDQTLDFVHEVETRWEVPVVWLEYTRVPAKTIDPDVYPHPRARKNLAEQAANGEDAHWFKVTDYENARRNGGSNLPFDEVLGWSNALPNVRTRSCSVQMKVRTMMRYLLSIGIQKWADHIGIRADEWDRSIQIRGNAPNYTRPTFPLIEMNVHETDVMEFWRKSEFDLQLEQHEGNCDLCFLKKDWKKRAIAKKNMKSIEWWESWEQRFEDNPATTGDGKYFRLGKSYKALRINLETQQEFAFVDDEEIPCGCFDRGFDYGNALDDIAD